MGNIATALGSAFDSDSVDPAADFGPLPPGEYTVEVIDADMRPTKKGDGQYVWLELSVIEPAAYVNRKLWANLNIVNPSAKAQEIGLAQFSSLCRAAGIRQCKDTDELINKVVNVDVKIKPADGTYGESNAVTNFSRADSAPVAAAPVKAAPAKQADKPWRKQA